MSRLIKQWNREYIVMKYGIYIYQANDVVASIQPKINSLFGYDQAKRNLKITFPIQKNIRITNIQIYLKEKM